MRTTVLAASASRPPGGSALQGGVLTALWPHVPELRGYLRKRLPASDVDDVVQDIFVRLVHRGDGVVEYPRRYLYQVALATLIDRHRSERSRCAPMHCELGAGDLPHDDLSPDRFVLAREDVRIAQDVLSRLPERTRAILIAVRLEGASLKTVATAHGISVSAVEKHLIRALRALRDARQADSAPTHAS